MSWPLFNHNNYWGVLEAEIPETIATNNCYNATSNAVVSIANAEAIPWRNRTVLAVNDDGSKMFLNHRADKTDITTYRPLFSSDSGHNWVAKEFPGATTAITFIVYHGGRWYCSAGSYSSRIMRIYYSEDDGDSWTVMDSAPHVTDFNWSAPIDKSTGYLHHMGNNNIGRTSIYRGIPSDAPRDDLIPSPTSGGNARSGLAIDGNSWWLEGDVAGRIAKIEPGPVRTLYTGLTGFSTNYWASSGYDKFIAPGGLSGSEASYFHVDSDSTDPDSISDTVDFGETIHLAFVVYANAYMYCAISDSDRSKVIILRSQSGDPGTFTQRTEIALAYAYLSSSAIHPDIRSAGGDDYVIAYFYQGSGNRVAVDCFSFAVNTLQDIPPYSAIDAQIRSQAPDIFYKFDDTGSPSTVVDIGRKNYTNATANTITFEQTGLVIDNGTAALFGDGTITAAVTDGADEHVHLFILSHDNTASARPLLAFGSDFTITLAADHKVSVSDGTTTLTSTSAITASTATLVIVSMEKVSCGNKVNVFIQGGHEGYELLAIDAPNAGSLVLSGNGVTIDYYAMIQFANADVAALQRAWGVTPTLPAAPGIACGTAKLLIRADTAISLRNHYDTELQRWKSVYGIPNLATGALDAHVWAEGGSGTVDLADGKFGGGSLSVPARTSLALPYLPHREPTWVGFHDQNIGTRDFTIAGWVKILDARGWFFFVSSQTYARIGSKYKRYGGLTVVASRDSVSLYVGHTYDAAISPSRANQDALHLTVGGYAQTTLNDWNYVTLCRKDLKWYITLSGKLGTTIKKSQGNINAPIVSVPQFANMFIGKAVVEYANESAITSYAYPAKFDDVLFVMDEALYTQDFTPPTATFEI